LTLQQLRLFNKKGVEYYNYDNMHQLAGVDSLYYSFGEDYNYSVRLGTLTLKKELGSGGFGTVYLMFD
jgi:hypothetical protein